MMIWSAELVALYVQRNALVHIDIIWTVNKLKYVYTSSKKDIHVDSITL